MAFFTRDFYPTSGFTPLFNLLDELDPNYRPSRSHGRHSTHVPTFSPKFDVRELENAFELHGELPGMDKQNVHIEFTDPQTLVIRGRIERTYQSGNPPTGLVEGIPKASGAITEAGEEKNKTNDHHATVEDEPQETASTSATEVAHDEKKQVQQKQSADKAKYWVSERSIGEFSRRFSFPCRINQEDVHAKLDEGILTVVVPKAPKHEARHINIA